MRLTPASIITMVMTVFPFLPLSAQFNLARFEIGAGPALFIYQGDLSPAMAGSYRTAGPGFAIWGSKIINSHFSLRANFTHGSLMADDAKYSSPEWRRQRNFRFKSPVTELSALAVYNIAGSNGNNEYRMLSPYVFGGIGYSFLRVSRDYSEFNTTYFGAESWVVEGLADDINHSTPGGLLVMPVGIGVRYPLNANFSIAAESTYRISFTDYLDGFSKSAGPTKNDHFHSHLLSLIYTFKNYQGIKCPVVKL